MGSSAWSLSLGAWLLWPAHFFPAYLVGFLFWVGIALGCIGLTMLHHLVGGSWGLVIRRPLESGAVTVLPLALLFLPIALGLSRLYPWASPGVDRARRGDRKEPVSERDLFPGSRRDYFVIWIAMAFVLTGLSARQDSATDHAPSRWLQGLSGPGVVLLFLAGTFSAIDWGMSLEPDGPRRSTAPWSSSAMRWRPWR